LPLIRAWIIDYIAFRGLKLAQDITEFWGEKFEGFKGQEAINKLLQEKRGHIPAAFHRDDIGDIALIWGDEKAGLA
jgi:hypothetical protein